MEKELNNTVNAVGNYNSVPTSVTSAASVVTMIDGLTITKVADKPVWADGELTYTITISNNADKPYVSVTIDGVEASSSEYEYDTGTNTLTVNLTDIDVTNSKVVTFKVRKK